MPPTVILSSLPRKTNQILGTIGRHILAKDPQTYEHSWRVEKYAGLLAAQITDDPEYISQIRVAALVHDVGKILLPLKILHKPSALTPAERAIIHKHPQLGYEYLSALPNFAPAAQIILHHHEWWNGRGYPNGIKNVHIPIEARILAIADAFEAMTGTRPYRPPFSLADAIQELKNASDLQFDPILVKTFIACASQLETLFCELPEKYG